MEEKKNFFLLYIATITYFADFYISFCISICKPVQNSVHQGK